jgi:hypothetical protein
MIFCKFIKYNKKNIYTFVFPVRKLTRLRWKDYSVTNITRKAHTVNSACGVAPILLSRELRLLIGVLS